MNTPPSQTDKTAGWTLTEGAFFQEVLKAHGMSALRGNISHQVISLTAVGSGNYFKTMAAGINTLGGLHAPLPATFDFLSQDDPEAITRRFVKDRMKLPGWGSHFSPGAPDPIWASVHKALRSVDAGISNKIDVVTKTLHELGKQIYPNPSAYTAAAGIVLGFNRQTVGFILIYGRLPAWMQAFNEAKGQGHKGIE